MLAYDAHFTQELPPEAVRVASTQELISVDDRVVSIQQLIPKA